MTGASNDLRQRVFAAMRAVAAALAQAGKPAARQQPTSTPFHPPTGCSSEPTGIPDPRFPQVSAATSVLNLGPTGDGTGTKCGPVPGSRPGTAGARAKGSRARPVLQGLRYSSGAGTR